ncbi:porin PorA family protein [Streptomyces specialis]|uniref:porin PorA family protein n=1 Tax=Streptomyces specialis TaxID=498367 RepID=UPI00073F45F8|nr:porin PorA family protein [Streptomyces specialis]
MRRSTWILSGIAAALLVLAAVTRFALLPAMHKVPDDVDENPQYEGTATVLNQQALASGDLADAFLVDVPVLMDRHIEVVDTSGDTAVFSDSRVLLGPDDIELTRSEERWAVDRVTLEDRPAPEGSGAAPHEGLVIGFPLEPERRDYRWWDHTTGTEVAAVHTGTEKREGRTVYGYTIHAEGAMADRGDLPPALPREAVGAILASVPGGTVDPATLPETVPLAYTATTDLVLWIDSGTGTIMDGSHGQTITATTQDGTALFPVADVRVTATEETRQHQADTAKSIALALTLLGVVAPLSLIAVAVVLLALAAWGVRRRAPAPPAAPDEPTPLPERATA